MASLKRFVGIFLILILSWASAEAAGKRYPGRILPRSVEVREAKGLKAPVVATLYQGYRINVVAQTKTLFRIEFQDSYGRLQNGYVEKHVVGLDPKQKKAVVTTAVVGPSAGKIEDSSQEIGPTEELVRGKNIFSFHMAPVFSLYRFGATQFRVGGSYERALAEAFWLGLPIAYTFGDGFSSIQGGAQGRFNNLLKWDRFSVYQRTALLFERFSGNGRSFMAGTIDVGLGARYQFLNRFSLELEPISFEAMLVNTEKIPWNLRGQVRMELKGTW